MYRTTTPTYIFTTNLDLSLVSALNVTFAQNTNRTSCGNNEYMVVKTLSDCILDIENSTITVTLTQEDTNVFYGDHPVQIQIHVLMGETALQSSILFVPCYEVLNDEVLT